MSREIIIQAEEIVRQYTEEKSQRALKEVTLHQEGKGCNCPNCLKSVVSMNNSWVDWKNFGDEEESNNDLFAIVKSKGGLKIIHAHGVKRGKINVFDSV
jgi:hypothetical protein